MNNRDRAVKSTGFSCVTVHKKYPEFKECSSQG